MSSPGKRLPARGESFFASHRPLTGATRVACLLVACLLPAASVRAQASDPELRPTRGPFITNAARAGDADATALELNPGLLALLPGGSLELVGAGGGNGRALPRQGGGLYWGTPIASWSAIGLGFSGVASSSSSGIDEHLAFRLAYALRLGRGAGLGVAWGHVWRGAFAGTDTFDLGLAVRLGRFAALGATVEDVGEPRSLPRLWSAELALRPAGTNRFEIAAGAGHANGDRWADLVPRGRISVGLTTGLRLYGEGERSLALPPASGHDTRFGLGLAFDFGHAGAAVAGYAYVPSAGDGSGGVAGRVHVAAERRLPLAEPSYVARVAIGPTEDERAFVALVRRLRTVAADPGAIGVVLKIDDPSVGMGRIEELRGLIALLRAQGKRTFAYATIPSTRAYYLAAAADVVYLHPAGELMLAGLSQSVTFYKGAMDRIGVHLDLVRIGPYKGAMEPFVMNEQSPEVRANKTRLVDDIYARLLETIAADRTRAGHRMDAAGVRTAVDRALFTPEEAKLAGLVDGAVDETELDKAVARAFGRASVRVRDADPAPFASGAWPGRRVAVVLVDGTIVDGSGQDLPFGIADLAGSDTLTAALEHCRADATVGAVVLRVNSPGGSGFASDVIARAVRQVRAAGKPVIVSMGDLAASGGYYIAAPADEVFADPSTITGSIGVFGFKVDVEKLMGLLGLSVETTRRGAHADLLSPYRPWTDEERRLLMDKIRHMYDLFVDTVAAGRKSRGLTAARVDEIGRGQVWTGATAQTLGLVDRLGGLSEAIDEAARLARVPTGPDRLPEMEVLPRPRAGFLRRAVGLARAAGAALGSGEAEGSDQPDDGSAGSSPSDPPEWPSTTLGASSASFLLGLLATPEGRAATRLLAPLVRGSGFGVEARLPYDIELR